MQDRLSLFNFDVVRELCSSCSKEKFHFVPKGEDAEPSHCSCGASRGIADLSDTSIGRLVTRKSGEIEIVPRSKFVN